MKRLILAISLLTFLAVPALATKTAINTIDTSERVDCGFSCICWTWEGEFYTETCDAGGAAVWAYGTSNQVPALDCDGNPIGNVLGTVLNAAYPNDSGERVVLEPAFTIPPDCPYLEICHWWDIEANFDGGNVELIIGGAPTVITPMGGYSGVISTSTSFYAWCVDMQEGWSGHQSAFQKDCFDLSNYVGETVNVAFKFGSDSSVTYPGWYIKSVTLGGMVTATDDSNWSAIKALY